MSFKVKVCQVCGEGYQPTGPMQKYCAECGPVAKAEVHKVNKAKWCKDNAEKRQASKTKRRKANLEKAREADNRRRKEHPEQARVHDAKCAERRKEYPEKVKARRDKWRWAKPEKIAISNSKRRDAKYANTPLGEMLTSAEWLAILAEANGHCHYCDKEAKLTLDHVIPLSKGGKHSKDNVVPACKRCNSSKRNKTLEEWLGKKHKATIQAEVYHA